MAQMESDRVAYIQKGMVKVLEYCTNKNKNCEVILSPFHSSRVPSMTIASYVERIVKYVYCSCEALVASLMFIMYHTEMSGQALTIYNVHRMIITSIVIAAKARDDEYYCNSYYSKLGGILPREMGDLELSFIRTLEWDSWVEEDCFNETLELLNLLATTAVDSLEKKQEMAEKINAWEKKQRDFWRARTISVASIMEADALSEAKKMAAKRAKNGSRRLVPDSSSAGQTEERHSSSLNGFTHAMHYVPQNYAQSAGYTVSHLLRSVEKSANSGSAIASCFYPGSKNLIQDDPKRKAAGNASPSGARAGSTDQNVKLGAGESSKIVAEKAEHRDEEVAVQAMKASFSNEINAQSENQSASTSLGNDDVSHSLVCTSSPTVEDEKVHSVDTCDAHAASTVVQGLNKPARVEVIIGDTEQIRLQRRMSRKRGKPSMFLDEK